MRISFHTFGPVHLAFVGMVPLLAGLLAVVQRKLLHGGRQLRFGLAILLFACTVAYYGSFVVQGLRMFPNYLPLELCDASLWLVIAALLTLKPAILDVTDSLALTGAATALLTRS